MISLNADLFLLSSLRLLTLLRFYSLLCSLEIIWIARDHSSVLPIAQCLQTVVSYIFSVLVV